METEIVLKSALNLVNQAQRLTSLMGGDTEADLIAGDFHNISIIAVRSGIRNQTQLELQQPKAIAQNLEKVVVIITAIS